MPAPPAFRKHVTRSHSGYDRRLNSYTTLGDFAKVNQQYPVLDSR